MLVIGLAGRLGSGKDHVARNILLPLLHDHAFKFVTTHGFADALKVYAMRKYNHTHEQVFAQDKDLQIRRHLQECSSEKDWVHETRMALKTLEVRGADAVIITDVRSKREAQLIMEEFSGFVFRLEAPKRTQKKLGIECNHDTAMEKVISSHDSELLVGSFTVTDVWSNDDDELSKVDIAKALRLRV